MSHDATNWAIKQRGLKPATKIVLWQLCDRFHPDNGCFPSQEMLAEDCEMSRSALNQHLDALAAAGLVARERRHDDGHRRRSTRYRFAFEADFVPEPCPESGQGSMSGKDPEPCPENGESHVRIPDTNLVREPVREPERERCAREASGSEPPDAAPPAAGGEADSFLALAKAYPTGFADDLDKARRAYDRLPATEREAALAKLPEFLGSLEGKTRKHPPALGSYLADRRWTLLHDAPKAPAKRPSVLQATIMGWTRPWWWLVADWCETHRSLIGDPHSGPASALRRYVSAARNGLGWNVGSPENVAAIEERAKGFVQVAVGSAEYRAWRGHFRARYGVDLPEPDKAGWIFMPGPEPPPDGPDLGIDRMSEADAEALAG